MKTLFALVITTITFTTTAFAQGISSGALEFSVNAVRSEGDNFASSIQSVNFVSAPIRLGYKINDQFTLMGGIGVRSFASDGGANEDTDSTTIFTVGGQMNLASGLMLEGSWTRLSMSQEQQGQQAEFVGSHFEGFAGRRFQFDNGLYVEPKAGITFGTLELDDNNANVNFSDNIGSEVIVTLGYIL